MTLSKERLKAVHANLNKSGKMQHKKDLVFSFSNGRTESSKELTEEEAEQLINSLKSESSVPPIDSECDKKRKRLIGMSYGIGADADFVKNWCEKYGTGGVKKKFNEYNSKELSQLIGKFQNVETHRVSKTLKIQDDTKDFGKEA